jgi:hypothetical protein
MNALLRLPGLSPIRERRFTATTGVRQANVASFSKVAYTNMRCPKTRKLST